MTALHKEVDAPPYLIVINAEREYLPGNVDPNGGFFARLFIKRPDGAPVYKNFLMYQIGQGDIFPDLQDALNDAENRAREAIADGFPVA